MYDVQKFQSKHKLRSCLSSEIMLRFSSMNSWLRHCATSRKVAGSIPDNVTGLFHWH